MPKAMGDQDYITAAGILDAHPADKIEIGSPLEIQPVDPIRTRPANP
jgi:hypothetical protein